MSAALLLGRSCARQAIPHRLSLPLIVSQRASTRFLSSRSALRTPFRSTTHQSHTGSGHGYGSSRSSNHGRVLLATAAHGALGTAAFVKLSEKDNSGTEQTSEGRMLQASRAELKKTVSEDERGVERFGHKILFFLDLYIWEPICTGVRFLQLVVIFVPVIISVPAVWIGPRQPDLDNERSGTLWWYGFLVQGMEWAGPAFIKVSGESQTQGTAAVPDQC